MSIDIPPGFTLVIGKNGRVSFSPSRVVRNLHNGFLKYLGHIDYPNQFDSVKKHLSNRFFLKLDIKDAFGSVTQEMIESRIHVFGKLGRYFFHANGGLIVGAPASSALFHLYCLEELDKTFDEMCVLSGMKYSRYCDDILISSPKRIVSRERKVIRALIRISGFSINERKSKLVDNKYTPLTFVGIHIVNGRAYAKPDFEDVLQKTQNLHAYNGMMAWKEKIIALNEFG